MSDFKHSFEVLEEAVGFKLCPKNIERIDRLAFEDLRRIARMVKDHLASDDFSLPDYEDSMALCNNHGPLGKLLGGYEDGDLISGEPEDIVSNIYFALLTNQSLALPDGLQYVLDYYEGAVRPPLGHEDLVPKVHTVLSAYAYFGELFRQGHLFIFPADVLGDHYRFCEHRLDDEFVVELSKTLFIQSNSEETKIGDRDLQSFQEKFSDLNLDLEAFVTAKLVRGSPTAKALLATFHASGYYGYRPLLYGELEQAIFQALVKPRMVENEEIRPHVTLSDSPVLLPHLGKLPVEEFAALKASGEAEFVARTIEEIEKKSLEYTTKPVELRDMVDYKLREATKQLDKSVKSSVAISDITKESVKASVVLASKVAWETMNERLASVDPWELLALGGAAIVAGAGSTLLQKHSGSQKKAGAVRAMISIRESFLTQSKRM